MYSTGGGGGSVGGTSTRSFPALGFDPAEGDQGAVQALILQVATANEAIAQTLPRLEEACTITDDADWGGSAAEEFSDHGDDLPMALGKGAESMSAVSNALTDWLGKLTANQAEADALEREAKLLKQRLERLEDELGAMRDCSDPEHRAKTEAHAEAKAALQRVIEKARRLRDRHLREANATAEAIRSGPDDAFEPENDSWYVQTFDGVAVAADAVSLATGTIAAGLAATGVGLPAAAVLATASTASGVVGSFAAVGQQVSGSRNAKGWLAVGSGLALSAVPGGGTAAAAARNGVKLAGRAATGKATKRAGQQAVRELNESLTSGGIPGLAKNLGEIRDKGLQRKVAADLKDAGAAEAKRLGVSPRDLSAAELRDLGAQAKQREAYADLVDKTATIAEKAGIDLPDEVKAGLKGAQYVTDPTEGRIDKLIDGTIKDATSGKEK